VPGEHIARRDLERRDLIAHERERLHGLRRIDGDAHRIVHDLAAKRAEVFDEDGHESFVARAHPRNAEGHATRGALRERRELIQSLRLPGDEISAAI
jgi:hypothetical protein